MRTVNICPVSSIPPPSPEIGTAGEEDIDGFSVQMFPGADLQFLQVGQTVERENLHSKDLVRED